MIRLFLLAIFLLVSAGSFAQGPNAFVLQMPGKPFPVFDLTGRSGKRWKNDELKGKVTLVSFWFVGCKSCMQEIPCLNMLQDSIRDARFQVISFARNTAHEIDMFVNKRYDTTVRAFKNYRSARQMNYEIIPSCMGDSRSVGSCELLHNKLHVNTYPVTMLVDKSGIVRKVYIGFPDPKVSTKNGILNDPGIRDHFYMMKREAEALLNQ